MSNENFNKVTKGKPYEILESHDLIMTYGSVSILKDSDGQFYITEEGQPDRGSPFFYSWKIKEELYTVYKKPSLASLKNLLAAKFFNRALFDVFSQKDKNRKLLFQIIEEPKLPKIKNDTVKNWFAKNKKAILDSKLFKKARLILEFEMPEIVHACQFKSDNILAVDTFFKNPQKNIYELQESLLDIKKKELVKGKIIDMDNGIPFFIFAKDYPIKPLSFGDKNQYSAKALSQGVNRKTNKIVIAKGNQELYTYEYPKESNLGRFWAFDQAATSDVFKNTVLFMYPIRDHALRTDYYVLSFELKNGEVIPRTKVTAKGDSVMSFSPNGLMLYSSTKEEGRRSKWIKIVQL